MSTPQIEQTRVEREMDAFRAAQADPRTQARVALDVAVERVAQELAIRTAVSDSIEQEQLDSTHRGLIATSPRN